MKSPPSGERTMFFFEKAKGSVVLSDLWNRNFDSSVARPTFVSTKKRFMMKSFSLKLPHFLTNSEAHADTISWSLTEGYEGHRVSLDRIFVGEPFR